MELHFTPSDCTEWAIAEIIGQEELTEALNSGKTLRVKFGIDPTSPNIHLGRSIPLWRLRAFQELGHEIHLIIGDFTGQIGDTSDKDSERPMLSEEEIQKNLVGYLDQLWLVLNPARKEQVFVHYNSEWLGKLNLAEIGTLADAFSVNSFIKRELIAKRLGSGSRVSLREMLYPLMQGFDSLAIKANVELGGTDQRFNLLAGRLLQERKGLKQQSLIMNPLINGTDGRKMSSSWGNLISLRELHSDPYTAFGKIMSLNDSLLVEYLWVIPRSAWPYTPEELHERLTAGDNPRTFKLALARTIVDLYHPEKSEVAKESERRWIEQFSEKVAVEKLSLSSKNTEDLISLIETTTSWAHSRSELRRVFAQGGVSINAQKMEDVHFIPTPETVKADIFTLKVGSKILVEYYFS